MTMSALLAANLHISFALVDIDECESFPCQNDGFCSDEINFYTCTCAPGYTGFDCESTYKKFSLCK